MKRIIAILLLALLLAGCAEQTPYTGEKETRWVLTEYTTEWDPWGDGDVTTSRYVYTYDIYGDEVIYQRYSDGVLMGRSVTTHDERGNVLTHQSYDCEGWIDLPTNRSVHTYDDQGRILTITSTEFLSFGKDVTTYTYDDEKNTMTVKISFSDSNGYAEYYYDGNGNILRDHFESDDYTTDSVRTYDENGNKLTETITATGLHYATAVYEYTYDEDGNCISHRVTEDGRETVRTETEYDDQGRRTRYSRWTIEYGARTTTYVYEDGKTTEIDSDGSRKVEYFDENGNIYRSESYDSDGVLTLTGIYTYTQIEIIPREE